MTSPTPTDPEALRAEIEQTRAELGETVEALAAKTDVKARARHAAGHIADQAKDAVRGVRDQAAELAGGVGTQVRSAALSVRDSVAEADVPAKARRPLPLALVAAVVAALGALIYRLRHRRS